MKKHNKTKNGFVSAILVALGVIFFVVGIAGGAYVCIWTMFIKPIIDAAHAFDAGTLTGTMIVITVLKCLFSGTVGSIIVYIGYTLSLLCINNA